MKSSLPPKVYQVPNPGPLCPKCHSDNTAYSCLYESLECHNCSELFTRPYEPRPALPKLIGYTEEGGHWYQTPHGSVSLIIKKRMKEIEDIRIRPEHRHSWNNYDPVWSHNWILLGEEIEQRETARDFFKSLTLGQLEQLKEQLNVPSM